MPVYKYAKTIVFDGFETSQDVDVSTAMQDARGGIWVLYDPSGNEIVGATQAIDAVTVRLSANPVLSAGNYKLVGLA